MSDLVGVWSLESSENINAYFKKLGNSLFKIVEIKRNAIKIPIDLEQRYVAGKTKESTQHGAKNDYFQK